MAAFERRVAVWDLSTGTKVSEFDTVLSFGGRRLVISADGTRVVAGAYRRYGIECYDASSGALIWRRKDLKRVQRMTLSHDDQRLHCGFERSAARRLHPKTGRTAAMLRGVANIHTSQFEPLELIDRKSRPAKLCSVAGDDCGKIERTTRAFVSVAFAPGLLLTSEGRGPVRCFRTEDAVEIWRFAPPSGEHAIRLQYNESAGFLAAILWDYQHGRHHTLCRFEPTTGRQRSVLALPQSSEYGFCFRGTRLLTWDGTLLDTESGETTTRLPLPAVAQGPSLFAH